jgi:hypothetical protein
LALDDLTWMASAMARDAWHQLLQSGSLDSPTRALIGVDPEQRRRRLELLITQHSLLKAATSKFPDPENWFWTKTLLEQSSDHWCATETAMDFPDRAIVIDGCCGAGADAIAISRRGCEVTAIDVSPVACALAQSNALAQGRSIAITESELQRWMDAQLQGSLAESYWHLDPDRRATGSRSTSTEMFQPPWSWIQSVVPRMRGASIKVAPATTRPEMNESLVSPECIRYLSRERSVRQQRWLWGIDRWPRGSVVVSVMKDGQWYHEIFLENDGQARLHPSFFPPTQLANYVGDYDPAIRAARREGSFAARIDCQLLDGEGGFLTADSPRNHPMTRWFRVVDVLTVDEKKLKAYARTHPSSSWELKSRGVKLDLDKLQQKLVTTKSSPEKRTVIFGKIHGRAQAIVAIACPSDA